MKNETHNHRDARHESPGNQDPISPGHHGGGPQARGPDYLALGQISAIVPSRPHPSCIWRWCRRGVKSRSGERVRLEHVRIGGKIYSTAAWLDDFGRRLAEADAQHFDARDDEADALPPRDPAYGPSRRARRLADASTKAGNLPDDELADIERELEEEGL